MSVETYYNDLINVESCELYKRYIGDDYVDEYRLACLKILKERDHFLREENAHKIEEANKEVYYEGYNFITAWKLMFKRCVDFEGRSCRSEFWYAHLNQCLMSILFMVLTVMELSFFSGIIMIYLAISVIPLWALTVRRLHDVGKSGWFLLLNYIPFGGIYLLILFCRDGQKEKNEYGDNPKKRERKKEKTSPVVNGLNNKETKEDEIEIIRPQIIKNGNDSSEVLDLSNNEKQSIKENDTTDNNINETTNNTTKEEKQPIELNGEIAFCRKCGTQLLSDSEFCHKCGCERVRWKKTT